MVHIRSRVLLLLPMLSSLQAVTVPARAQCSSVFASGSPVPAVIGNAGVSTSWDPDGSGPIAPWLVVAGHAMSVGNLQSRVLLAHDGTQWGDASFPPAPTGAGFAIRALAQWNGDLIVGGLFTIPVAGGSATNVARWDGAAWHPLGGGVSGQVAAVTVHNGELVVAGSFLSAGGVAATNIARWNGTTW